MPGVLIVETLAKLDQFPLLKLDSLKEKQLT